MHARTHSQAVFRNIFRLFIFLPINFHASSCLSHYHFAYFRPCSPRNTKVTRGFDCPWVNRYILGRGIHTRVVSRRKPPRDSIKMAEYSHSRNDGKRIAITVVSLICVSILARRRLRLSLHPKAIPVPRGRPTTSIHRGFDRRFGFNVLCHLCHARSTSE